MIESVWQAVKSQLSGERAKEYTGRLWQHAKWNTFASMRRTAEEIAAIMREIGVDDVQLIEYPSDGVTSHAGWVMPEAWDASEATLEILEPAVDGSLIADYSSCPWNLITFSAPTPSEGLVAGLVVVNAAHEAASYEGRDVRGKLVLVDGIGPEMSKHAFERGAVGIVCDHSRQVGSPHDDATGRLDDAVQWHNCTIPPWKWEHKRFGFSITPAKGRRLRELAASAAGVKLRAVVKTRLYEGTLPLVTGLLPGETDEEIALTAHLCEPGANDDSSGCALGLESVLTIAELVKSGAIPPLKRGLRPVFSFEVRGLQAFIDSWHGLRRLVAGINLDMVGHDLNASRSWCNVVCNFAALPAYTDHLIIELVRRLKSEEKLFRHRIKHSDLVDNVFGDPGIGAPMCVIGAWPDTEYHNSLDTIDTISPKSLAAFGRVAATYVAFLAGAGLPEAQWLTQLVESHAEEELLRAGRSLNETSPIASADAEVVHGIAERNVERLKSVRRLARSPSFIPTAEELAKHEDDRARGSGLLAGAVLAQCIEDASQRVRDSARRAASRVLESERCAAPRVAHPVPNEDVVVEEEASSDAVRAANMLVPVRQFKGVLSFESLDRGALEDLKARTGLGLGWGAAQWAMLATMLATGKRTVAQIHRRLLRDGSQVKLEALVGLFEFLRDHGLATARPVLTKANLRAAFDEVGVVRGSVTLVHSSLSRYGYVEGGAATIIDGLLEHLSPEGTLVMPVFSCSFAGRPPFDTATTPSQVGAVSEAFRTRDGVLRDPHPTHSVAALGPHAERITSRHSPSDAVFADTGSFGKLYDLDAYVLMLAPLKSNTCLHVGEERAGVPLRDIVASIADGDGDDYRAVTVRRAPWHVDSFDEHHRVLNERGLIRSAVLGEDRIHQMRYRDAVDVATENLRRDPLLAAVSSCECSTCCEVRATASRVSA